MGLDIARQATLSLAKSLTWDDPIWQVVNVDQEKDWSEDRALKDT